MNFYKLETFLRGGIWFARLNEFGDSLEGTLPAPNTLGLLGKHPSSTEQWLLSEYQANARRAYASCWHISDADPTDVIWQRFSERHQAVAIKSTVEALDTELAPLAGKRAGDGPLHRGRVRYIDHATQTIPSGNLIEAAFVVRQEFSVEAEARYLLFTHGTAAAERLYRGAPGPFGPLVGWITGVAAPHGTEFIGGYSDGKAIVPGVNPRRVIQEVVVGAHTPCRFRIRVARLLMRYGLLDRLRLRR